MPTEIGREAWKRMDEALFEIYRTFPREQRTENPRVGSSIDSRHPWRSPCVRLNLLPADLSAPGRHLFRVYSGHMDYTLFRAHV